MNLMALPCVAGCSRDVCKVTPQDNVRAIGLYGTGGAGKTTICKSLCNGYFVKFNGKVWHAELGKKISRKSRKMFYVI